MTAATGGVDSAAMFRALLWDGPICVDAVNALCRRLATRFASPFQWLNGHWGHSRGRAPRAPPPPPPPSALRVVKSFQEVRRTMQEHPHCFTVLVLDIDYTVLATESGFLRCAPSACHAALLKAIAEADEVVFITGRPGPAQGCDINVEVTLRELQRGHIHAAPHHVVFVGHVHKGPALVTWLQGRGHGPAHQRVLFVDDNMDCINSVAAAAPHVECLLYVGEFPTRPVGLDSSGAHRPVHLKDPPPSKG